MPSLKHFGPYGLIAALLLPGCTTSSPPTAARATDSATADCTGMGGIYRDVGEPDGESLIHFLLGKPPPKGRMVQIQVSAEKLQTSSGATVGTLFAGKDFNCSGAGRMALTRQESSRIHLPPLIDQSQTLTHVLSGGVGADLVLSTYMQTGLVPYGVKLQGPVQLQSTITWRRASP